MTPSDSKTYKAAIWYQRHGFSVIPIDTPTKKPKIKWEPYQHQHPTEQEITTWWTKWPKAGVGIVTGAISGLTVVDIDSEEGREAIDEFLSDSIVIPTVKSPRGWHLYFRHCNGLPNKARVITGCDIRNDGGYIIAPPSHNGNGGYAWVEGGKINNTELIDIPSMLKDIIINSISSTINCNDRANSVSTFVDSVSTDVDIFQKGTRDESLFHLAHHLVKGQMPLANIRKYLKFYAEKCDPPFPPAEVENKIKSALKRFEKDERNIAAEVREWVESTSGDFLSTNVRQELTIVDMKEIKYVSKVLGRLVDEGVIERVGNKNGQFRKIEKNNPTIDILNVSKDFLEVKYPLRIEDYFRTMPKNIVIVAGTQDSGKTAFMLNFAKLNMNRGMKIKYQSSEMGALELRSRIELFNEVPVEDWVAGVEFHELIGTVQDAIEPNAINIIDYLEISDSFYVIGGILKKVMERLENGIAMIGLQMDDKADYGRGGSFSKEKPRLYLTLKADPPAGTICSIKKCKNWRSPSVNPNHLECIFKIRHGCEIRQVDNWRKPWEDQ